MPDFARTAIRCLEKLYAGQVEEATRAFGPGLRGAVSDETLGRSIAMMIDQFGRPVKHTATRTAKTIAGDADIVYLTWDFERQRVDARIVISPTLHIISLSFETPVIR